MIIVAGTTDLEPSQREAFLESRREAVAASRSEPGCIEHTLSADLHDPGRVRIFEVWENAEALAAHLALNTPPNRPNRPTNHTELLQYEVSRVSPLPI